jgi:hypothetical protein
MTDFSKTLIRCSSLGQLLTEPKEKAAKDAGELSETAKTMLIREYIRVKYDRDKDLDNKYIRKGKENEEEGIKMLSLFTGNTLEKNNIRLNNDYVTGEPDVFLGKTIENAEYIYDTKLSWDIWTFLSNVGSKLNKDYELQMQGYLWLSNCQEGAIAYILTDIPETELEDEKYSLLRRMKVATELDKEYIKAAAKLEINSIYPDIPLEEKILLFPVQRNEETIQKIKQKVEKARTFLQDFEQKHLNFNKKTIIFA